MSNIPNWVVLLASLLVAIGGWGIGLADWADLLKVSNFFSLLAVVGGVVLAWLGASPLAKK